MKKLLAYILAILLTLQPSIVFATSEPADSSDVLLTVVPQVFSAIVPTVLPVNMNESGVISVSKDATISNMSKGPIRVDNVELTNVKTGWEIVDFDMDFNALRVGSYKLAMSFNNDNVLTNGTVHMRTSNWPTIDGLGKLNIDYDAKIPAQDVGLTDIVPANAVFTLKWHEVGSADITEDNPNIYEFVSGDEKTLTINFKGIIADNDTVVWSSSNEAVATVADYVSKGRARPIDGSKQCLVTAVGSGKATITGVLGDGTTNSFDVVVADKGVVSIDVTKSPDKVAYIEGENFSSAGMIVVANYNNGTSMDISDYVIADGNNLIIGQDSVTVNYNGKSATQPISVVGKSLTSIAITSPPDKISYVEGNDFDATGMVVTAYYDNGMNKVVVPTLSRNTNLVVGQIDIDVSYGGQTITQSINVGTKSLANIIITGPPTKTSYIEGNNFDATGMIVTAYYNNGTSAIVIPTLGRNTNLTVGQTSVDVSFEDMTVTQAIDVVAKTLTGIAITTPPNKTTYIEANNFDSTGMVVAASYNNGTISDISDYVISDGDNLAIGKTSVNIDYNGKSTSQAITVAAKTLANIVITSPPTKISYIEGNSFDSTGMIVTANYDNGTSAIIAPTLSRNTNLTTGQTSVDVSFGGKTITQTITVSAKTLTSIAITIPPTKTAYIEGNSFDKVGMVVTAYYNNGTSNAASPTFGRHTNMAVGQTSVDISFGGKTITQAITVASKTLTNIAITTAPSQTSYIEANNFNPSGMIVTAYYNNGTTAIVSPMLGRNTNLTTGQTSVDVSFGGKAVTQAITVVAKSLASIAITTQPNKKSYIEANNFDSTGMIVTATYNNGTTGIIVPTFDRHTNLATGQTTVDVSFGDKTVTQDITVVAKSLTSIAITTQPNKKSYIEANNFDSAGMVVIAYYDNGTSSAIRDYVISDGDNLAIGKTSVNIDYNGKSTSQAITVVSKTLTSIAITTQPTKTAYVEANSFNAAGMVVMATYNNGSTAVVVPTFGRNTNLTVGQTSVDVNFGGKTITQAITVATKTLTSIAITTSPSKTAYIEANNFDATGMVVTATYDNGTTATVSPMFGRDTNLMTGQTTVDVSFGGKTVVQSITVVAKTLTSIAITTPPTKTIYAHWDNFDMTGMVVTASYNNGTTEAITNYSVSDGANLVAEKTSVSINYDGKTTNQVISVNAIVVGAKHSESNYEYSYGQHSTNGTWKTVPNQKGWGVRVLDKTQTDYASPLTVIQEKPVTTVSFLFQSSPVSTLNLIDWNTSNLTNMSGIFSTSKATNINGLNSFNTSKVTDMSLMFSGSQAGILDLSNLDTSNVTDMSRMFEHSFTQNLDLSGFDTSNVTNMNQMFYYSKATNLDVSSFDTSNATTMKSMFEGSQATSLDVSSFNTSNVTDMSCMFYGSESTNLDLSSFNTSNVTDMWAMFAKSKVTSLDLSKFNTPKLTNTSSMFSESQATSIDVSSFDTSKVTNMYGMFGYSEAKNLDLSSFDTSNVTNMQSMFFQSKATSLDLSSFDTSKVTNMSYMFRDTQVTSLNLSNFDTSSLTNMSFMLANSQAISIDLSNWNLALINESVGSDLLSTLGIKSLPNLKTLSLKNWITPNITDMSNMFFSSKITNLNLSGFNTSNVTNMENMFYNSKITSLDLRSFDTSMVTDMSQMFYESQVASLDLSSFDTSKVTNMQGMFYDSQATSLNLSSFDTSKVTDMRNMFLGSQAVSLDLSSFNTSNVTDMYSMFYNSQATSLDLSSFDTSNVTDMSGMFNNSQATNLDLSSFNTSNVTNMISMFKNSKATGLDLSSFDTSNVTNMQGMFYDSQATSLNLSSFDISNVTNMNSMFRSSKVTNLNLSNFNTSKVTDMDWIVYDSHATNIDLSNWNLSFIDNNIGENMLWRLGIKNSPQLKTLSLKNWIAPNITDMGQMFYESPLTTLNLSGFNAPNATNMMNLFAKSQIINLDLTGFNTSNVTNMSQMFWLSQATNLNLSSFNTTSVTNMANMFHTSNAISITGLNNFNTSSVTNMTSMFSNSNTNSITGLNSFNTAKVIDMSGMFSYSQATSLDLTSFNTANVINMNGMFSHSKATNLSLTSFDTSKVTDMSYMFWNSPVAALDLSSFNTSKVTNINYMFWDCKAKTLLARTTADANNYKNGWLPAGIVVTVKA